MYFSFEYGWPLVKVPNTKVVANIQIYLHAKVHIFLRSQVFFLFLFSPADLFNWKNHRGSLFPRSAQLSADPAHLRVRASLPDGARQSAPSSPKSPLLHASVSSLAKFPATGRPPVTTPRHKEAHVFACRLEPSHRLRCAVASHHRCAAALLSSVTSPPGMPAPGARR
jgi:hypothetical protein